MSGREFAGTLGERVTLSRPAPARDLLGGWTGGWTVRGSAWALVEPVGGHFRVTMRPRLLAAGDRIAWGARTLRVREIVADPALPDRIVVTAEEERE